MTNNLTFDNFEILMSRFWELLKNLMRGDKSMRDNFLSSDKLA